MRARREVLLAGGAINSPQLLQLSGIGPGALLQQHGIDVVHDLPGVGENLQDHCGGRIIYRCTPSVCTMNEMYHNWLRRIHHGMQYSPVDEGRADDRRRPDGTVRAHAPGTCLARCAVSVPRRQCGEDRRRDASFPGCTLVAIPCRPESRGWLRITSPDPAKPPAIQPNYLATQADKDTMVAGLKVSRRIFATSAMRQYVTEEYLPGPQARRTKTC